MPKYFTYLIVFLFLSACNDNTPKEARFTEQQIASLHLADTQILVPNEDDIIHINLNPFLGKDKEFDFGSLIKDVKLIPLETTDKGLVAGIYKIITTDGYIYIMDNFKSGSVIIFTSEGKFVKRLSHGQGPGELQRLYDIDYDFQKDELVAYQHSFLLFFDKQGNFLRQERLPLGFNNIAVTPNGYVMKAITGQNTSQMGDKKDYRLLFTDKKFKLNDVALPEYKTISALSAYTYLHKVGDLVKITSEVSDTIYQYNYKNNKLAAEFVLDYDKKLPRKYIYGETFDNFDRATENNDYYFCIGEYFETTHQNVFFVRNQSTDNAHKTIVYRDKKTGNMVGGRIAKSDKGFAFLAFIKAVYNDAFISTYTPSAEDYENLKNNPFLSLADKEKIKHSKDDDNPVLVYFTLKEF